MPLAIATVDSGGRVDVSPKGDPAGFVRVLDEKTLAIPDRPGNFRFDTFINIMETGRIGLCFVIPKRTEVMRGNGIKRPADTEKNTRHNNRKSIVLNRAVHSGERLGTDDLAIKRPGYGIAPKYFEQVVGRVVRGDMEQDAVLGWDDLA